MRQRKIFLVVVALLLLFLLLSLWSVQALTRQQQPQLERNVQPHHGDTSTAVATSDTTMMSPPPPPPPLVTTNESSSSSLDTDTDTDTDADTDAPMTYQPIYTDTTIETFNKRLSVPGARMILGHLPDIPSEKQVKNKYRFMFHANERHIYVVDSLSLLFLPPYTRFYTYRTISERFYYLALNFTEHGRALDRSKRSMDMALLRNALINETILSRTLESSGVFVCFTNAHDTHSRYFFSLSNAYNCTGYKAIDPFDPKSKELREFREVAPPYTIIVEFVFEAVRYIFIYFLLYYMTKKLRVIQRLGKDDRMSNSLYRPPFWPNMIRALPFHVIVNFRIWEVLWLLTVLIVLYSLNIMSVFVPFDWPEKSGQRVYTLERLEYLYVVLPAVCIHFACIILKLMMAARKDLKLHETKKQHLATRAFVIVFTLFISCLAGVLWVLYVFYMEVDVVEKMAIHAPAAALMILFLFVRLYNSPVYKLSASVVQVMAKLCCVRAESKEQALDHFQYFSYLIFSHTLDTLWYMSCVLITFNIGSIINQLTWSTISNFLLNSESVKTYGYALSLAATIYKFSNDIEAPFASIREIIFSDRPTFTLEEMEKRNDAVNKLTEVDFQTHGPQFYFYHVPITWVQFARLARMSHVHKITKGVLVQGSVTVFVLCLFFLAAQTFNATFFSSSTSSTLFGVLVGTVMPLIPQLISFFNFGPLTTSSPVFKARCNKCLLLLEAEQKQLMVNEKDYFVHYDRVYFRFALVHAAKYEEKTNDVYEKLKSWRSRSLIPQLLPFDSRADDTDQDQEYMLMERK